MLISAAVFTLPRYFYDIISLNHIPSSTQLLLERIMYLHRLSLRDNCDNNQEWKSVHGDTQTDSFMYGFHSCSCMQQFYFSWSFPCNLANCVDKIVFFLQNYINFMCLKITLIIVLRWIICKNASSKKIRRVKLILMRVEWLYVRDMCIIWWNTTTRLNCCNKLNI